MDAEQKNWKLAYELVKSVVEIQEDTIKKLQATINIYKEMYEFEREKQR